MKTSLEKLENSRVRLTVDVTADVLENAIEQAYRTMRKQISIPGFRKGRAPRKIIELNYGVGVFLEEALDILLPKTYQHALAETEIRPVEQPEADVKSIEPGEGAQFTFEVDVYPEVELGNYEGLEVEREIIEITAEDVENVLKGQQERAAQLIVVDGRSDVRRGDFAVIDFIGYIDGRPFSGGAGENQTLEIGSGQFIPGFEEQLIGKEVGEEAEVTVTFPSDYHAEELAGKEAVFKVTVKELKEKSLPEIDDEFVKDISDFDTLDELKAEIRKNLEDDATRRTQAQLENRLLELIAEDTKIEVPKSMVDHQAEHLKQNFLIEMQRQGINEETYLEITKKTADDLREDFAPQALTQVVHDLILESVAKQEGIEVSEEEVDNKIEEYFDSNADLDPEVEKNIRQYWEGQRENIKLSLEREKTMNLIIEKAVVTEVPAAEAKDAAGAEEENELIERQGE